MANTAFGAAFDKALRAFQTGGITHNDFLSEIDTQMEGGASVSEMLDVLWRREQIEALPPPIHAVVLARIEQPLRQSIPAAGPDADRDAPPAALAADEFVFSWDSDPFAIPAEEQQQYLAGTLTPELPAAIPEVAVRTAPTPKPAEPPKPVEPPKAAAVPKVVEPRKPVELPKATVPPKVVEPPKPVELPKAAVPPRVVEPPAPIEPPKATVPPKVVEPPKPVEPPKVAAVPKVVEPPKPVEPLKTAELTKAAVPAKVDEPPKPVDPPKPAELTKAAVPPKVVDPPKPVEPPKVAAVPKVVEPPPKVVEPPKPVELSKVAVPPKPVGPPKTAAVSTAAQALKSDDGPNRLGRAIARELRDWLSPARRPNLPDAAPSVLSEVPKEKVKDVLAPPSVTPPLSEPPRFSKLRSEPRNPVPDTAGAASLAKRIFSDAPHVAPPPVETPRKDSQRADAPLAKRPVFETPRVSTSRPEPRTVLLDPRSAPPIAAPPLYETPRVSTSRPEPRTVVLDPRSAPPITAPPRADASNVKPPVFETPRVSTARPEPRTVVLDPRVVSPIAVPTSAPKISGPSITTASVDVTAFETPSMSPSRREPPAIDAVPASPVSATPPLDTAPGQATNIVKPLLEPLRVSTARSEAPTVVLGDRLSVPMDEQGTPSIAEFFGGRFRLIEQVADSDMSRVYRAEDVMVPKAERREIALKVFKRSVASDATAVAAMQSEFARVHALSHPNLVQLIECGTSDGTPFVTMEWLTGMSLYRRLDALAARHEPRGLPAREARNVINGVARALEYAHARGVVHGDLKPGNVFLCSDGSVKLIDFGLSMWFAHAPLAASAPVVATPRYASPQVMARQGVTQADDVYAFACVVYEIMSGHYPFAGVGGVEDPRFVPLKRPSFTNAQYAALLGGLAQETAQRIPSVHAFMQQFGSDDGARRIVLGKWAALVLFLIGGAWLLHASGLWHALTARLKESPEKPAPISNTVAQATFRDCRTCPLMVVIPAGQFEQDVPVGGGRHSIVFEHPFAMAAAPITVAEYQAFVTATRRDARGCEVYDGTWRRRLVASFKDPGFPQTADHPVTCVSWTDAVAYAEWLSQTTGHSYNLPSAAQWEYSARAGSTGATPWDANGNACALANVADKSAAEHYKGWNVFACSDGFLYTSPVDAFPANAFGLRDTLGNVLEWTLDCWQPNAGAAPADGSARGGRDCRQHEVRGASWFSSPSAARLARREHFAASLRISTTGLRVVRQVDR